jgi:hypothetical protein
MSLDHKKISRKNAVVALVLIGMVCLFYGITVARLGGH